MTNGHGRRVCVIGAGISGLVSAKVLAGDDFDVTVYEKEPALGGVWAPSRTYPGLHTNNIRATYCFSDHPYPKSADEFPSAEQVRAYLHSYAERFGLLSKLELDSEVLNVTRNAADDAWSVTTRKSGSTVTRAFDFIVVCNGVFSRPKMPEIEGRERFKGEILHSSECTDPRRINGKRVVIVGTGKSATDCASWAARDAASSTLLFRRGQWMVPRYFFGFLNSGWVLATRAIEFPMHYYPTRGLEKLLHDKGQRLVRMMERGLYTLLRWDLRLPQEMSADIEPLAKAFTSGGVVGDFPELARSGAIKLKKDRIARITEDGKIALESGDALDADVLIFATGWQQETPFLDASILKHVRRDGHFQLYRMILPPTLPTLGFVGYNSSNTSQLTSEIAAHWLSDVFLGRIRLPGISAMEDDIALMLGRCMTGSTVNCRDGARVSMSAHSCCIISTTSCAIWGFQQGAPAISWPRICGPCGLRATPPSCRNAATGTAGLPAPHCM